MLAAGASVFALLSGACQPSWPKGVELPDPVQEAVVGERAKTVMFKGAAMKPLAEYRLDGLVLSTKTYRFGVGADHVPLDVAFGWGPMADAGLLEQLRIRQNDRYFFWSSSGPLPASRAEIEHHAANVHLLWAANAVDDVVTGLEPGDAVRLEGLLVQLTLPDGNEMTSSLSREDTGGGACEVMFVETATVLPIP